MKKLTNPKEKKNTAPLNESTPKNGKILEKKFVWTYEIINYYAIIFYLVIWTSFLTLFEIVNFLPNYSSVNLVLRI